MEKFEHFEFGGCIFSPYTTFESLGLDNADLKEFNRHLYTTGNNAFKKEGGYTHEKFYDAAGGYENCPYDVFYCGTNTLLYVPTKYQLQIFFPDERYEECFRLDRAFNKQQIESFNNRITALREAINIISIECPKSSTKKAEKRLLTLENRYNRLKEIESTI